MGRRKLWRVRSAAHARACKKSKDLASTTGIRPRVQSHEDNDTEIEILSDDVAETGLPSDSEETQWTGSIENILNSDGSDYSWDESLMGEETVSTDDEGGIDDEDEFGDDPDLEDRLQRNVEHELNLLSQPSAFEVLMEEHTRKDWKKAESKRGLGYTGNSDRSRRRKDQKAREKSLKDAEL